MFEVVSCVVWECKAFSPDVTLNIEFLTAKTLRLRRYNGVHWRLVTLSMFQQAWEGRQGKRRGKCFSIKFFVYTLCTVDGAGVHVYIFYVAWVCVYCCVRSTFCSLVSENTSCLYLCESLVVLPLDSLDFSVDLSNTTLLHTGGVIHLLDVLCIFSVFRVQYVS